MNSGAPEGKAILRFIYSFLFIQDDHQVTKTEFDTDWVTTFAIGNHKESAALFSKADVNDDGVIDKQDLPGIFSFFDTDGEFCYHGHDFKVLQIFYTYITMHSFCY